MLPDDVSLYVEPISSDVGISLGAAYFCQILSGGLEKSERLPQLYLGRKLNMIMIFFQVKKKSKSLLMMLLS